MVIVQDFEFAKSGILKLQNLADVEAELRPDTVRYFVFGQSEIFGCVVRSL
jgi:hypothetical protein